MFVFLNCFELLAGWALKFWKKFNNNLLNAWREGKEETNKWKHEQHMGSKWQHLRVLLVTVYTLWHRKRSSQNGSEANVNKHVFIEQNYVQYPICSALDCADT